jgi:CofD-related protein of GAK system
LLGGIRREEKQLVLRLRITKTVQIPDRLKLARLSRSPELGPKLLFFSGGSALNPVARRLIRYTHNSVHLITPFDSGGSSAVLRKAFNMAAVGDLRNRMMALADQSVQGNPDIRKLFAYRFTKQADNGALLSLLEEMVRGKHPLVAVIPDPMRKIVRKHLSLFHDAMPRHFDLGGASIGNLVLAGGFMNYDRHLDPVLFTFSKLAEVRGLVRPVINRDLHLVARMADGSSIVGQHLLTGKEARPISIPIKELYLSKKRRTPEPVHPGIRDKIRDLIGQADLICFPMGSFYSSIIANLLPQGVTRAVARNDCPKVYIPNQGVDPETPGMTVSQQVETLLQYLNKGQAEKVRTDQLLHFVVVDKKRGNYPGGLDLAAIQELGVTVIDTDLASETGGHLTDPDKVLGVLLSLV